MNKQIMRDYKYTDNRYMLYKPKQSKLFITIQSIVCTVFFISLLAIIGRI